MINSNNTKILIACHKESLLPTDDIFLPIRVGAADDLKISNIRVRDDRLNEKECDNISVENKWLNEMTAVYWAWKNIRYLYPKLEYIGLNHYRRFFSFRKEKYDIYEKKECEIKDYSFDYSYVSDALDKDDLVVAKRREEPLSVAAIYAIAHSADDIRCLRSVIERDSKDYLDAFDKVFFYRNYIYPYNMTIMRVEEFCDYCEWVFPLLFACKDSILSSNKNINQKRAFITERLFNVWIEKNNKKCFEMPVYCFDDNIEVKSGVYRFSRKVRNRVCWELYRHGDTSYDFVH